MIIKTSLVANLVFPEMQQNVENLLQPVAVHYLLIVKQHNMFLWKACMISTLQLNMLYVFLMRQAFLIEDDSRHDWRCITFQLGIWEIFYAGYAFIFWSDHK